MTAKAQKPPARDRAKGSPRRDSVATATERLRQLIVTGELAPGSSLSQVKLAEMTGVSTTPIREALRLLEADGLVEARHNRRPRVLAFDPEDLDAIYSIRILLETTAIAMTIATLTDSDLESMEADLASMHDAAAVEAIDDWEVAHQAFHRRLVAGCGPTLRQQIDLMMSRSDRYRRMSVLGERPHGWVTGEAEHRAIVAACQARRPREAGSILAVHLARSARSVLAHLDPEHEPLAIPAALVTVGADEDRSGPKRRRSAARD